jgi:hypothetical protein
MSLEENTIEVESVDDEDDEPRPGFDASCRGT